MGQGRLLFCRSLVEAAHKNNTGGELQATKNGQSQIFKENYVIQVKLRFFERATKIWQNLAFFEK